MILTVILLLPFIINIIILIQYICTKNYVFRKRFVITAIIGFGLAGAVIFLSLFSELFYKILDFALLFWFLSGYLMITALGVKVLIFSRIYLRYQDPKNYHYNLFGKKVMHSGFLTNKEMKEFIITIPLFLFAGAYFIARLINFFLYGHL